MAKLTLTPQQQAVVENRGGSLLVSAAAGSGKTKVLVDRLFRYVTEERCNIDDFLIITYTKAAAAELRGKIAAELADFVIVTSDNPRTEQPQAIIDDILAGMQDSDTPRHVEPDRVEAIHYAMDNARPGDVIILAGKGHEDYQEINHVHYPMDERVIVADYLK